MDKFLNYTLDYSDAPFKGTQEKFHNDDTELPTRMEGMHFLPISWHVTFFLRVAVKICRSLYELKV